MQLRGLETDTARLPRDLAFCIVMTASLAAEGIEESAGRVILGDHGASDWITTTNAHIFLGDELGMLVFCEREGPLTAVGVTGMHSFIDFVTNSAVKKGGPGVDFRGTSRAWRWLSLE